MKKRVTAFGISGLFTSGAVFAAEFSVGGVQRAPDTSSTTSSVVAVAAVVVVVFLIYYFLIRKKK